MSAKQDLIFLNGICNVCTGMDMQLTKCADCRIEQWRQDAVMEIQRSMILQRYSLFQNRLPISLKGGEVIESESAGMVGDVEARTSVHIGEAL